jgi:hypothetical protein
MADRWQELIGNMGRFLRKFPEPAVELGCVLAERNEYWRWEQDYLDLQAWARRIGRFHVAEEIADAVRRMGPGERVAVFGCGAVLPTSLGAAEVVEFDRDVLDTAVRADGMTGHHAIGIRTVLPDQSVDVVVITSRLAGLWERWGENVIAEAQRIGRKVDVFRGA